MELTGFAFLEEKDVYKRGGNYINWFWRLLKNPHEPGTHTHALTSADQDDKFRRSLG